MQRRDTIRTMPPKSVSVADMARDELRRLREDNLRFAAERKLLQRRIGVLTVELDKHIGPEARVALLEKEGLLR